MFRFFLTFLTYIATTASYGIAPTTAEDFWKSTTQISIHSKSFLDTDLNPELASDIDETDPIKKDCSQTSLSDIELYPAPPQTAMITARNQSSFFLVMEQFSSLSPPAA